MFRESDMPERRVHPSYINKPNVSLQQISRASHIDESGLSNRHMEYEQQMPEAVPSSWDTYYDPSHPEADWTGQVSTTRRQKKHIHDNAAHRVAIERGEHGFYGREERQDFAHRRTMPGQNINGTTFVIGGIDEPDERFKSTYQRQAQREATNVDQLTLQKRQKPIKKITDPAQAVSNAPHMQSVNHGAPQRQHDFGAVANSSQNSGGSLIGYRAPNFSGRGQSMLSGIADKVAASSAIQDLQPPPAAAAMPHSDQSRLLIADNYKRFPGYTGCRK